MRTAYGLIGLALTVLIIAALVLIGRARDAEAPAPEGPAPEAGTLSMTPDIFKLASPSFGENELIPSRYTCDGDNANPELHISGAPVGTASFVLIVDDPDIPERVKESMGIDAFSHWILFNIPPDTTVLGEAHQPEDAGRGYNSAGKPTYAPPCPPDGEHRYFFKLYALSSTLHGLGVESTRERIEEEMKGKVIGETTLMARYARVAD